MSDVQLGDIGTSFRITLKDAGAIVPVNTATVKTIKFESPTAVDTSQTAAFVTDGKDGRIEYVSILGDIDEVGTWKIQAYVEMPEGKWHSAQGTFEVLDNLS